MGTLLHRLSWRAVVLIAAEGVLVVAAIALALYLRLGSGAWLVLFQENGLTKAVLIAFVCQICLYYSDLYDLRVVSDHRELFVRTLQALGITSLLLAGAYYWIPELIIGRRVFLTASVFVLIVIVGWRLVFVWATRHVRARERLLVVGTSPAAVEFAREIYERRAELGVEIVGFVDADASRLGEPVINPAIVGTIADIPSIAHAQAVDRIVVSLSDARGRLPVDRLLDMRLNEGIRFDYLAAVYEEYTGKIALENLRPSWLIFSPGFQKNRLLLATKRTMDLVAATVGLLVLLPFLAVIALSIKATSPGPVLYRQQRVGRNGRLFTANKLRTMVADAEAVTGAVWAKAGDDPRVTSVGRYLRRFRIDELPQLWNVLVGDMSLVGPRPERPEFVQALTCQIPFYGQRHGAKPGITGWAQVRYTYGASVYDSMQKLQYDLFYIKNMSISLDLYILFETIKTVLTRDGS